MAPMRESRPYEARRSPAGSPAGMQADIAKRYTAPKKPGFFQRLFGRKSDPRKTPQKACCMVGVLMLLDRGLALDGLIMGINERGVLFRQAAKYIFDRAGAEVSIRFGEHDRRGRIIEVTPRGHIVQFLEPMPAQDVEEVLASYGLPENRLVG